MHTKLQGTESILKVVWIVNHRNKCIIILHSYMIFVIFLDINLKSNAMTVNLMDRQLAMKTFEQENLIPESFWQNRKF